MNYNIILSRNLHNRNIKNQEVDIRNSYLLKSVKCHHYRLFYYKSFKFNNIN